MILEDWAMRWGINPAALDDLKARLRIATDPEAKATPPGSEAGVQQRARLAASQSGGRLWRNNVGAYLDKRGIPVRYGLCNESKELNKRIKSADLIGITPVAITHEHIGRTLGVFTSIECKHRGWQYSGTEHEAAQLAWANLILSLGGIARFENA